MNFAIIVQARRGSTRLPDKVLADIAGKPLLSYVIERVKMNRKVKNVILATTTNKEDDLLEKIAKEHEVIFFKGDAEDVLSRFVAVAETYASDVLVRITADCPLIDFRIIDEVVGHFEEKAADYIFVEGYPRGLGDVELLTLKALKRAEIETSKNQSYYREHVVTYLLEHPESFKLRIIKAPDKFKRVNYRLCVDEIADLILIRKIYEHFLPRTDFSSEEIINYLDKNPDLARINQYVKQKVLGE